MFDISDKDINGFSTIRNANEVLNTTCLKQNSVKTKVFGFLLTIYFENASITTGATIDGVPWVRPTPHVPTPKRSQRPLARENTDVKYGTK